MFGKKKNPESELDVKKLNDVIGLTKNILKIAYVLIAIIGIYAITLLFKEWHILEFIFTILKIIAPLFVGIIIAWLLDPVVRFLKQKGIKRGLGAGITYLALLSIIGVVIMTLVPLLSEQINEFAKTIPTVFDTIKLWIDGAFDKLETIQGFDANAAKQELFINVENIGYSLAESLPTLTMSIIGSLFSGIGILIIGLIIGFYLLVSFDNFNETIITFLPKKSRESAKQLFEEVNTSLRKYVQGTMLLATMIFVVSSIGFFIAGLKAPLLFGLFCGLTNIIPYAGPYIGGAPAAIVAFSQDVTIGIFVIVVILVVQFIEGNLLQPIIMSKTMKLHPVTIMIGLLVFGYFWGILGMILATPTIAAGKAIYNFFDERHQFFKEKEV